MRIISFCAEGIEKAAKKGFYEWVVDQDADIICVQDLRAQEYDLQDDKYFPEGYFPYFFDSPDSVNGVAIYVRQMPKAIMTGLGFGMLVMHRWLLLLASHEIPGCTSSSTEKKNSFLPMGTPFSTFTVLTLSLPCSTSHTLVGSLSRMTVFTDTRWGTLISRILSIRSCFNAV